LELKDLQAKINANITQRSELIRQAEGINTGTVNPEELVALYQEFNTIWDNLEKVDQRSIINLLVNQIEVQIKKKAKTGKLTVSLATGIPLNLLTEYKMGSSSCSVLLPRCNENKLFIRHQIPGIDVPIRLFYRALDRGESEHSAPQFGFTSTRVIATLSRRFKRKKHSSSPYVDMNSRVAGYKLLMDQNDWTQAELARQLGVSRAWVTKALKARSLLHDT